MIKLVYCLRRLPTLSREEFQKYWAEKHGPLVRSCAEPLRIKRYVQVHSMTADRQSALRARNGSDEEYDGVAELWWESFDDMAAGLAAPAGAKASQALLDDERNFIDLPRSPIWFAEEHEVISG